MAADALGQLEVWFVTGSQHLYGAETLRGRRGARSARSRPRSTPPPAIPVRVVVQAGRRRPRTRSGAVLVEANASRACIGVIAWMHTFSPAKMWIAGLTALQQPLLHLHTQFNRDLPWAEIDMDFMNLNQSAHGDREFGFIETRMGLARKTVVGHWQRPGGARADRRLGPGGRAAGTRRSSSQVARFGDNMRAGRGHRGRQGRGADPARRYRVNGYGVGDLVEAVNAVSDAEVDRLVGEYEAALRPRARASRRAASGASRCATRRGSRPGCAAFLERRRFRRVHRHLRGPRTA